MFERRGLAGSRFVAERFFRPRGAHVISLDRGFLPDPDGFLGKLIAKDFRRRAEIHETQCSVLLGEPGLGKSTTMAQRRDEVPAGSFFDLRTCSAQEVLQAVRSSCSPGAVAQIVIDSVDEADLPNFAARLVGELTQLPRGALRLELACRASEWPETLEVALPEVFGDSEVSYFHVQPLRRADAAAIVEAVGIDSEVFLTAVHERDLGPLAGVPLTLELLIHVFLKERCFPHRTTEIYEKALLQLCDERSPTRREQRRARLSPNRCLEIVEHLAAAAVLGNKSRFTERSPLLERDGELAVARVLPSIEGADEAAISEVLATGLFVHSGADTSAFYHHSFGEFLAARWLHRSQFSPQQLRQLLFHHEVRDHLVPQTSGLATWLACMDGDMAMLLADLAPENFIEADSPVATEDHRRVAVDALMRKAEARSLTRYWWPEVASKRLLHAGLAQQLRAYVSRSDLGPFVRRKAIYIARANELTELLDDVAAIALDEGAPEGVRVEAVEAAFGCAQDPQALAERLRSLVAPGTDAKTGDDLRAAVLRRLWPTYIDAAALFRLLTRPRRAHVTGSYSGFIRSVPKDIGRADLVTGLKWAGRAALPYGQSCTEFDYLAAAIFRKAWTELEDPACREAFALAAWRTLKVFRPVLEGVAEHKVAESLLADIGRRRMLLVELVRFGEDPDHAYYLAHPHGQPPFATEADIEWILEERRLAEQPQRIFWETLVCRLLAWPLEVRILELILREAGEVTTTAMLPFPLFVELGSPEALQAVKRQRQEQTWAAERVQREQEARARRAREIGPWLEKARQGDPVGWSQAVVRMRKHRERGTEQELLACFAEEADTQEDRVTYLRLAKQYLEQAPTEPDTWLSEKSTNWVAAVAGYFSIRLASGLDGAWWKEHSTRLLTRWASVIVGFNVHVLREDADQDAHRALVHDVFRCSPDEGKRMVAALLRREAADQPDLTFLSYLPAGTPIGDLLERELLTNSKRLEGFQIFFESLVRFDLPRALALADRLLRRGNCSLRPLWPRFASRGRLRSKYGVHRPRLGDSRRHSAHQFAVVQALLGVESIEAWQLARRACRRYPRLARAVFSVFDDDFHPNWGKHLADEDLAELYQWLPAPQRADGESGSMVPWRSFRQSLLSQLASRGSAGAVEALTRLEDDTPSDGAVQHAAAQGRHRYRELSWRAVRPESLFEMRRSTNRRLVESSEHLLEVVLDAIDGYAAMLQGKSSAVDDLWSWTQARKREEIEYIPKDENALSNHLKRHLQLTLSGLVVNREVEVKPTSVEPRSGEHVDLLVQAVCPQTLLQWTVVIEVKCSWNPELLTHLDQQLYARYLRTGELKCGVYLVGWYACSQWGQDWRREATRRLDRALVEKHLLERAEATSNDGRTIRLRMLNLSMGEVAAPNPKNA